MKDRGKPRLNILNCVLRSAQLPKKLALLTGQWSFREKPKSRPFPIHSFLSSDLFFNPDIPFPLVNLYFVILQNCV